MTATNALRTYTNDDAARMDWDEAIAIRPVRKIKARLSAQTDTMRNGECPPVGYMVVTDDKGKLEYCLPWQDFFALYAPTGELGVYEPQTQIEKRMILLDHPFCLEAPLDWKQRGHQGWRVTDAFRHAVSGQVVEGYPIIEEKQGREYHADPGLWQGDYALVSVPPQRFKPAA